MTKNNKKIILLASAYLLLGIMIFISAYVSVSQQKYLYDFNRPILEWSLEIRQPILTVLAKLLTNLASATSLISVTIVIVLFSVLRKKELLRPLLLLSAMAGMAITSTWMKIIVMGPRPLQQYMIPSYQLDYSFPSGHTLGIWTFLLTIGYLFYSRKFSINKCLFVNLLAVFITAIIATTRLYLGYHWLTDIVASIGLGLMITAIVIFTDSFITRSLNKDR